MKISDNTLFYAYNNLYSSKKAVNMNQNQFNQSVSNSLSANNASDSVTKVTLYKDALLSTHNASGASAHVFYDESTGAYNVKGTDVDGKEFEALIDIKNIDPNNASRTEMLALAAYLGKQGDSTAESYLLWSRKEADEYFALPSNEQKNFKWKSIFTKENQYDDLKYIAQSFFKAGAMDGYVSVNNLIRNINHQIKNM